MTPSDDLYQLIASMDKNEKRYCRLALQRGVGKEATRSLALFDAVVGMRTYDEALLRKKLKGTQAERHFAAAKHDLYLTLLRYLHSYHAAKDPYNKVRELLDAADILLTRGLLPQSQKLNARAMVLAKRYDLYTRQINSLSLEFNIRFHHSKMRVPEIEQLFDEIDDAHLHSSNYWEYRRFVEVLAAMLLYDGKPRNADERRRYDTIVHNPLLQDLRKAKSFEARRLFHDAWRLYYLAVRDYERGYRNSLDHIALLESPEGREKASAINYPVILHTHLTICIRLDKLDEAEEAYRKMLNIPQKYRIDAVRKKQVEYNCLLAIAVARLDFAAINRHAPTILGYVRENAALLSEQIQVSFPFIIAFAQFRLGAYKQALRTLGPLMNETYGGIREDYQLLTKLLRMMIHYEMGDYDLIPYLWRSSYRYLKRRNGLYRFERVILDFLRKLPDAATERKRRTLFAETRDSLIELKNDPNEEEMVAWFNIIPWLDEKIRPGRGVGKGTEVKGGRQR